MCRDVGDKSSIPPPPLGRGEKYQAVGEENQVGKKGKNGSKKGSVPSKKGKRPEGREKGRFKGGRLDNL